MKTGVDSAVQGQNECPCEKCKHCESWSYLDDDRVYECEFKGAVFGIGYCKEYSEEDE